MKIIVYDDFKQDNAGVYKEVLRFVGVDHSFVPDFQIAHPHTMVRFAPLRRLAYSPSVQKIARNLPNRVYRATSSMIRAFTSRHSERRPIDNSLKDELRAKFAPEVGRLSRMLGRELRWLATRTD